jgi:amino acid permease
MTTNAKGEHQSFWLWVMCLTGVDYFSTLGYQPSIAFDATGLLAPLATVVLVAVTLGCALPVYCHVASESPHGQGSIAMLERLLRGWTGKLLVLVLLGFAATDFVITKTLSAADAAEHLIHNPFWQQAPVWLHGQIVVTMLLLVVLGAVCLRGFREVIAVAVVIVGVYLLLNTIVIGSGLWYLVTHGGELTAWFQAVTNGDWHLEERPWKGHDWWTIIGVCLLFFPKLALGLSGFETGVAVMPLVIGAVDDDPQRPAGRIRNTRKLLITAALIMSVMLLGSAMVTSTLIDPVELAIGGEAADRALAFIAHGQPTAHINPLFGRAFGTIYDVSTVAILWFAGASAMSGLLNLVPRYLPRFGMAPKWASAFRPLVLLFTVINLLVTWVFGASVSAQGGAYATGVMVLMTSACVATVIDRWKHLHREATEQFMPSDVRSETTSHSRLLRAGAISRRVPWIYASITVVFAYTTVAIMIEKPDGIRIAGAFILAVVVSSAISRTRRSTELRFERFEFIDEHSRLLWDALRLLEFPVLVPHRPGHQSIANKDEEIRLIHRLGPDVPIVFVEASLGDTSAFEQSPLIEIIEEEGRFVLRLTRCVSISHALATVALELSKVGKPPELHFGWSDESPLVANLSFVLFGEGNIPWLVRELLHKAELDATKRPRVIIG